MAGPDRALFMNITSSDAPLFAVLFGCGDSSVGCGY